MRLDLSPRVAYPFAVALLLLALAAFAVLPSGVRAATVVNGDFETGNLDGWSLANDGESDGSWFAYSESDELDISSPPQGEYASVALQDGPGRRVLYQDVALEPGMPHRLSMFVYYFSAASIAIPSPDTLNWDGPPNQQFRVDVVKPSVPIETLSPSDVLATVFRTAPGDPEEIEPTFVSADLSAFAGQTVRIRLVEVDNEDELNASADAISIASTAPPTPPPTPPSTPTPPTPTPTPTPPSNAFAIGKLALDKKNGTARLPLTLPGPGTVTAVDARTTIKTLKVGKPNRVKRVGLSATSAGQAVLHLKPTAAALKALRANGRQRFQLVVTFTPNGGTSSAQSFAGALRLKR